MIPDIGSNFDTLPPEAKKAAIAQLMHLGSLGQQNDALEEQLQQAIALQRPSGQTHVSAAGGAIGGLGDILRGISGTLLENKARGQQAALQPQMEQGRSAYANLLFGGTQPEAQGADPFALLRGFAPRY